MSDHKRSSTAVMARRTLSAEDLEFFPTPPWATRALLHYLAPEIAGTVVWEPACGRGDIVKALREARCEVFGSDVEDYGAGFDVVDFLWPGSEAAPGLRPDWIVTNPPFAPANQFVEKALEVARQGVAMFVRLQFLEGQRRYEAIWRRRPARLIGLFTERVNIHYRRLDPRASGQATAYCWVIWDAGRRTRRPPGLALTDAPLRWIPPCRRMFDRASDYDAYRERPEAPLFDGVGDGLGECA